MLGPEQGVAGFDQLARNLKQYQSPVLFLMRYPLGCRTLYEPALAVKQRTRPPRLKHRQDDQQTNNQ